MLIYPSAIDRYLPLLAKRTTTTTTTPRPLPEIWKCSMKPCKKTTKKPTPTEATQSRRPLTPPPWIKLTLTTTTFNTKNTPEISSNFTTWIKLATVKPYTFMPRWVNRTTSSTVDEAPTTTARPTTSTKAELLWVEDFWSIGLFKKFADFWS